mmetsp:Transcript_44249/g.60447  ORF Transcript_44249/g.60447 Transcript_44249/m.60447 type:complete len:92 (-) Transcript_44249:188-463(-)
MTRCLYDSKHSTNVRDEIISAFSTGSERVVVDVDARTRDAQLIIRELVEDSPSMAAFSSVRSAMHKDGIFFVVKVPASPTPEIMSRASWVF